MKTLSSLNYGMVMYFRVNKNGTDLKNLALRQLTRTIINKSKVGYFEDGALNTKSSAFGHLRVNTPTSMVK